MLEGRGPMLVEIHATAFRWTLRSGACTLQLNPAGFEELRPNPRSQQTSQE